MYLGDFIFGPIVSISTKQQTLVLLTLHKWMDEWKIYWLWLLSKCWVTIPIKRSLNVISKYCFRINYYETAPPTTNWIFLWGKQLCDTWISRHSLLYQKKRRFHHCNQNECESIDRILSSPFITLPFHLTCWNDYLNKHFINFWLLSFIRSYINPQQVYLVKHWIFFFV